MCAVPNGGADGSTGLMARPMGAREGRDLGCTCEHDVRVQGPIRAAVVQRCRSDDREVRGTLGLKESMEMLL